ncbi:MAG: hypothetical protein GWP91_19055 [Rhodobacterales bacterium]|nr:hypothetical protein [Rhodobacterales bacterium]
MAKTRPSVQKRIKEAKVHEKKLAKAARKAARDSSRGEGREVDEGVDPDLVGLVAGPQVIPWHEEGDGVHVDEEG